MNLYIFTATVENRTYKFSIFAPSQSIAEGYRDQIKALYQTQADRLARAAEGLNINEFVDARNYQRLRSVAQFSSDSDKLQFQVRELTDDQIYGEYYGRRMGKNYGGIAVFKDNELVDEFDVDLNTMSNYDKIVDKQVNELQETNSPSVRSKILNYVRDFFDSIPAPTNSLSDMFDTVKLIAKKKELFKLHGLNHVNFDLLNKQDYEAYSKVNSFIKAQQQINSTTPRNCKINAMMICAARVMGHTDSIAETLDKHEQTIKELVSESKDINATDQFGRTPLMYVVLGEDIFANHHRLPGRERFVNLLIENGADPSIEDIYGKTALDYFKEYAGKDHPSVHVIEEAQEAMRRLCMP